MFVHINSGPSNMRLRFGRFLVRLGNSLMLIGHRFYGSSVASRAGASHTNNQNKGHKASKWLKNLTELAFLLVVGYELYLRPASYNHNTRHWIALFEYAGSYLIFRYITAWAYRKWKERN